MAIRIFLKEFKQHSYLKKLKLQFVDEVFRDGTWWVNVIVLEHKAFQITQKVIHCRSIIYVGDTGKVTHLKQVMKYAKDELKGMTYSFRKEAVSG